MSRKPTTEQTPARVAGALPPAVTELDTAIRVAQRMLRHYGTVDGSSTYAYTVAHGGLTEALRLLLRALGAEAVDAR
ncbi:hypothetical protein GA0115233_103034 [Streptomyces sp. DI166]|uniref:hypothetical protein n=1 Tax=Streptomyces sp. DI166 TaxID=1839783 RepID=UPI0007F39AB1|nr:hypothetical protein [Streptomyces sp. DI166]SBT91402.1 hypothetical protein GA0115233_103034 [Streptomyces sp. DI166]